MGNIRTSEVGLEVAASQSAADVSVSQAAVEVAEFPSGTEVIVSQIVIEILIGPMLVSVTGVPPPHAVGTPTVMGDQIVSVPGIPPPHDVGPPTVVIITPPSIQTLRSDCLTIFFKSPGANESFGFDFSRWVESYSDLIREVIWGADTGVTLSNIKVSGNVCMASVAGGTLGTQYLVRCMAITWGGRTDIRSFILQIQSD